MLSDSGRMNKKTTEEHPLADAVLSGFAVDGHVPKLGEVVRRRATLALFVEKADAVDEALALARLGWRRPEGLRLRLLLRLRLANSPVTSHQSPGCTSIFHFQKYGDAAIAPPNKGLPTADCGGYIQYQDTTYVYFLRCLRGGLGTREEETGGG
eukprot:scaffold82_cov105-Isochrysis_galbana.AAC.6